MKTYTEIFYETHRECIIEWITVMSECYNAENFKIRIDSMQGALFYVINFDMNERYNRNTKETIIDRYEKLKEQYTKTDMVF